jgi:hypothetical protein
MLYRHEIGIGEIAIEPKPCRLVLDRSDFSLGEFDRISHIQTSLRAFGRNDYAGVYRDRSFVSRCSLELAHYAMTNFQPDWKRWCSSVIPELKVSDRRVAASMGHSRTSQRSIAMSALCHERTWRQVFNPTEGAATLAQSFAIDQRPCQHSAWPLRCDSRTARKP